MSYKEYAYQKWYNIACEATMREREQRWIECLERNQFSLCMTFLYDLPKYVTGSKRFIKFIKSK
jgi:hypothetical protein